MSFDPRGRSRRVIHENVLAIMALKWYYLFTCPTRGAVRRQASEASLLVGARLDSEL